MNFDLQTIAPDKDSKYSPNLYKWLRKHRRDDIRVYRRTAPEGAPLYVGYIFDGDFIGQNLMFVLGHGARAKTFCYPACDFEEVPGFWARYIMWGRCAIDTTHTQRFTGDEWRWARDGDTRTCQWCGAVQKLRRWEEVVQRQAWESVQVVEPTS